MRMTRRVSWNECDPSGRIRFQAVFDWAIDAEVAMLRAAGVGDVFGAMPRVACEASYSNALSFDDEIEVEIGVDHLGSSSTRFAFRVLRAGEECVRGTVTAVHVIEGQPAPLPDDVRAALETNGSRS